MKFNSDCSKCACCNAAHIARGSKACRNAPRERPQKNRTTASQKNKELRTVRSNAARPTENSFLPSPSGLDFRRMPSGRVRAQPRDCPRIDKAIKAKAKLGHTARSRGRSLRFSSQSFPLRIPTRVKAKIPPVLPAGGGGRFGRVPRNRVSHNRLNLLAQNNGQNVALPAPRQPMSFVRPPTGPGIRHLPLARPASHQLDPLVVRQPPGASSKKRTSVGSQDELRARTGRTPDQPRHISLPVPVRRVTTPPGHEPTSKHINCIIQGLRNYCQND